VHWQWIKQLPHRWHAITPRQTLSPSKPPQANGWRFSISALFDCFLMASLLFHHSADLALVPLLPLEFSFTAGSADACIDILGAKGQLAAAFPAPLTRRPHWLTS
jgi:hypothetical protein